MATLTEELLQAEGITIAKLLEASKAYDDKVASRLHSIFAQEPNRTKHGNILWTLMAKEPGSNPPTVLAKRCGVYLQYYLISILCKSHQRTTWLRLLTVPDLCFLTAIAAVGFESARGMVDAVVEKVADWPAIQALHISQASFSTFFYNENLFCFSNCIKIIEQIWELWDFTEPKLIHGFLTPHVSKKRLDSRKNKHGAFIFRFDSAGSLTIDFVTSTGELASGKVDPHALTSSAQLLHVITTSPTLSALVDSRQEFSDNIIPKEQISNLLTARIQKLAGATNPTPLATSPPTASPATLATAAPQLTPTPSPTTASGRGKGLGKPGNANDEEAKGEDEDEEDKEDKEDKDEEEEEGEEEEEDDDKAEDEDGEGEGEGEDESKE